MRLKIYQILLLVLYLQYLKIIILTNIMIKTNIIKETKWKEVSIQENKFDFSLSNSSLLIMSQISIF